MKQEFKTTELRQTAEAIRDAVLAKSITPDMVGGTMLALVNASGEVIEALGNLESERVTVKVQAYDGQSRVDVTGAKVYLDQFSIGGVPMVSVPRQEYEVDENGEVTFEVLKGYQYTVFSKLDGMAASFQFAYEACQESRTIELWHFPVGVWMFGQACYYNSDTDTSRGVPLVTESFIEDLWSEEETMLWDADDAEGLDDAWYDGILVATSDTSFVIERDSKADGYMPWCSNRDYGKALPTMPLIFPETDKFDGDWDTAWNDAVERARKDYDGNLNTAKILTVCKSAPAADYCGNRSTDYRAQCFLPSAGQLYLIYLNKTAINSLMQAANNGGDSFVLIDTDWYWSSTQYDEWCAWSVYVYSGRTYYYHRFSSSCVRAVSAFHFDY